MDGSLGSFRPAAVTPVGAASARPALVADHEWIPDDELPALRLHFLKRARQVRTYQPAYASALFRVATDYGAIARARRNP
ncbi:hypothetical protein [Methylocaldum sp.]|uniref:hypothetical protein n=1 Tax=Methylocaldum sp. TaxID=1969727 RepID=UPI002D682363|nr:hypothetical protein [Methylocaldum sp.]HYE38262.1 hypothetical protein [Methylocaldum sp.]